MSKGNLFQGMARGSVGDVTFTRLKGQQVARVRNRQPSNPQTKKQMTQRALFANAVRFYTRGNQNMFKFAFEDKKPNESDYNAFMRNNVANSIYISKTALGTSGYPAIGNWLLSSGTLPSIPTILNEEEISPTRALPGAYFCSSMRSSALSFAFELQNTSPAELKTVAGISKALITNLGFSAGDILTFVFVRATTIIGHLDEDTHAPVLNGILPNATPLLSDWETETQWVIGQIKLDVTDTRLLNDTIGAGIEMTPSTLSTDRYICDFYIPDQGDDEDNCYAAGAAMIVSRNTVNGLKVSKQYLANNECTRAAIAEGLTENFKQLVLNDWGATEDAILQGSLVQEA